MKKIITLLLACMIVCAIAVPCLADEVRTMTVTVSNGTVNVGDTITVTVSVSEVANCTSIGLGISFDADAFEIIKNADEKYITASVECEQATCEYNSIAGCYVAKIQMRQAQTISGNLFTFQLKVKDGAAANKDYSISGIPSIRTSNGAISAKVNAASVKIACTHTYDNDCDTSCNICSAPREPKHNYKSEVTKKATCSEEGVETFTCTGCNDKYTKPVAKTKHNYKSEVTKKATCSEEGVETFTCTGCNDKYTKPVAKTKHNYKSEVTKEATCSEKGVKTFTCTGCKDSYTEEIAKTKHNYKSEVTKEATCAQEGVKTVTCQACGHSYTDAIKKTDHKYEGAVTVDATCLSEGVETFTCTGCGKTYEEVLPKLEHEYDHDCDAICNLCSEVRPIEHLYSERYSSDETGHWLACTLCQEVLELIPHNPGPEATEETDQICLDCGYVICAAGTHIHEETGDWLSDDSNHWHLCSCGEIMGQEEHTWQESVRDEEEGVQIYFCTVCGHPKVEEFTPTEPSQPETEPSTSPSQPQETKPSTQPTQPDQPDDQDGFPWWIVILAVGVLLVGAVIFVIIGILRSRKQTGKYSS